MEQLLAELPSGVWEALAIEQFAKLDQRQAASVSALGDRLGGYVVAHRPCTTPGLRLWHAVGPAYHLDEAELEMLRQAERKFGPGIFLVAYARPMELRLPPDVLETSARARRQT